jgi:hypothetical protein
MEARILPCRIGALSGIRSRNVLGILFVPKLDTFD